MAHTLGDLATRSLVTIRQEASLQDAAALLSARHVGALVAVDRDDQPVGILSTTDLVRHYAQRNLRVKEAMSPTLFSLPTTTPVADAARLLANGGIHRVLVSEDTRIVGVVTVLDIARLVGQVGLQGEPRPGEGPTTAQIDIAAPRALYEASLARCATPQFGDRFYARFIGASPEIASHFAGVDMARQKASIMRAFHLAADIAAARPGALAKLTDQATLHDRDHKNIRPELYDVWLESLTDTVRECDPAWTPMVDQAWRIVLGHVIAFMRRRY